jgi:hypothetical protein
VWLIFNDTTESLANLIITTPGDHGTVATLIAANAQLTAHLAVNDAAFKSDDKELRDLNTHQNALGSAPVHVRTNINFYCWHHGNHVSYATIARMVTRSWWPRTTTWVEISMVKNDANGQIQ